MSQSPQPQPLRPVRYRGDKSWSPEIYNSLQAPRGTRWDRLHAEAHSSHARIRALSNAQAPRSAPSSLTNLFEDRFTSSSTNCSLNEDCWAGKLRKELHRPLQPPQGRGGALRRSHSATTLESEEPQSPLMRSTSVMSLSLEESMDTLGEPATEWFYLWEKDNYTRLYHPRLNCAVTPLCHTSGTDLLLIPLIHHFVATELQKKFQLDYHEVEIELGEETDNLLPSGEFVHALMAHYTLEMSQELTVFKPPKVSRSATDRFDLPKLPQMYGSSSKWPNPESVRKLLSSFNEPGWMPKRRSAGIMDGRDGRGARRLGSGAMLSAVNRIMSKMSTSEEDHKDTIRDRMNAAASSAEATGQEQASEQEVGEAPKAAPVSLSKTRMRLAVKSILKKASSEGL